MTGSLSPCHAGLGVEGGDASVMKLQSRPRAGICFCGNGPQLPGAMVGPDLTIHKA
ncbi:hypothetical protein QE435_002345 [Rhizobium sp. SORGH_AS 787]|nr:hypothetical protein [Rhizobium sp. SORGH_AS_0787]